MWIFLLLAVASADFAVLSPFTLNFHGATWNVGTTTGASVGAYNDPENYKIKKDSTHWELYYDGGDTGGECIFNPAYMIYTIVESPHTVLRAPLGEPAEWASTVHQGFTDPACIPTSALLPIDPAPPADMPKAVGIDSVTPCDFKHEGFQQFGCCDCE